MARFFPYTNARSELVIKCAAGHIYKSNWQKLQQFYGCPKCSSSPREKELVEWLKSLDQNVVENSRDVIDGELDVYLPSHQMAIEYNGLYFHSEKFRSHTYHLDKLKKCKKAGIRLVQIFEHEWVGKKDQVKSFIRSKLGLNQKIPARKTKVQKLSKEEAKAFFNSNHILGYASGETFALNFNNETIMAVIFSRHHRGGDKLVLSRLCSKSGVTVVGGLQKLIKGCGHKEFITFADRRYSEGEVYLKIGMTLSARSSHLALRFYVHDGWTREILESCLKQGEIEIAFPGDIAQYFRLNHNTGAQFDVDKLMRHVTGVQKWDGNSKETDEEYIRGMNW